MFGVALGSRRYLSGLMVAAFMFLSLFGLGFNSAGFADHRYYDRERSVWRNPIVKQAAIGAGIGAATGVLSERTSVVKGAVTGGLVGAGTGAMDNSRYLNRRPLVKSVAKGALIGTGASYATDRSKAKGAVVGAAAGVGTHYVRDYMNRH